MDIATAWIYLLGLPQKGSDWNLYPIDYAWDMVIYPCLDDMESFVEDSEDSL
jgi:hypothetical protein